MALPLLSVVHQNYMTDPIPEDTVHFGYRNGETKLELI